IVHPSSSTRKMIAPLIAILWRTNRLAAIRSWPRLGAAISSISAPAFAPGTGAAMAVLSPGSTAARNSGSVPDCAPGWVSGKANPRVEHGVEHVGENVEHDDGGGDDHQPRLHDARVWAHRPGQSLVQELAHPVPAEGDLGQDRPAENGREVK